MSIKPIDYNVMLPKTHEVSQTKHIENTKQQNIMNSNFIQQEKNIGENQKRVLDPNESSNPNKLNKDSKNQGNYSSSRNKNKKKKDENKEIKTKERNLGDNIDIHI